MLVILAVMFTSPMANSISTDPQGTSSRVGRGSPLDAGTRGMVAHRGINCELVGLRRLIVQLPDHSDDAAGTVDSEELGGGLEGVEDTAARTQVRVCGVHDEDGRPHRRVLGMKARPGRG